LCLQEPELGLKRIAASALSDIAKHTPELAQVVVDAGAVAYLAPLLVNQDAKLKRQVIFGDGLHLQNQRIQISIEQGAHQHRSL
jgi:pantothenate kinase